MTQHYSEDQVIATIVRLTRPQLMSYVEARIVTPLQSDSGPLYQEIDIARIELLCDLSQDFNLSGDSLDMVISLIDRLHAARADMRALMQALANEPPEVQSRVASTLRRVSQD